MIHSMKPRTVLCWLVLVSSIMMVTSQNQGAGWTGCVNPNLNKNQNLIRIGQPTRVCLSVANDTDWNSGFASYVRASFEPKADVYSRFHIPNSYRDLVQSKNSTTNARSIFTESPTITVSASSQMAVSFVRVYYDAVKDRVYPFLTAIMDVDNGVIKGITWDDACVFCGGTECVENTYNFNGMPQNQSSAGQNTRSCFVSTEDCNSLLATNSSSTVCDLTLYTVWSGTDANGIALQSQAYRFSAFPAQELSDRITQLLVPDAAADFINSGGGSDNTNTTNQNRFLQSSLLSSSSTGAAGVRQIIEDHYYQSQSNNIGANGAVRSAIVTADGDL